MALTGITHWAVRCPAKWRVSGSILGGGTCVGRRPGHRLGCARGSWSFFSFAHHCFSPTLPLSPKINKNKILKKKPHGVCTDNEILFRHKDTMKSGQQQHDKIWGHYAKWSKSENTNTIDLTYMWNPKPNQTTPNQNTSPGKTTQFARVVLIYQVCRFNPQSVYIQESTNGPD